MTYCTLHTRTEETNNDERVERREMEKVSASVHARWTLRRNARKVLSFSRCRCRCRCYWRIRKLVVPAEYSPLDGFMPYGTTLAQSLAYYLTRCLPFHGFSLLRVQVGEWSSLSVSFEFSFFTVDLFRVANFLPFRTFRLILCRGCHSLELHSNPLSSRAQIRKYVAIVRFCGSDTCRMIRYRKGTARISVIYAFAESSATSLSFSTWNSGE